MKGNGDGVINRPFEAGVVRNDRLESFRPKRFTNLSEVGHLESAASFELRDNVTEQL
jgi:hypothetical protein